MPRRFTGLKPTGALQLGNYLAAIRPIVDGQREHDTVAAIVDLHALTVDHSPQRVRADTLEQAMVLLAAGVDPEVTLLYVQSHVPHHTELHYLLECVAGYGEAHRMIQFKQKSAGREHVRLSLLTYPVLMAADILLHDTEEVPVGADQRQHVELTRDLAERFNSRYGETFVVPRPVHPATAARIMDLADPAAKMDKTAASDAGVLYLLDPPDVLRRKIARAVTDGERDVRYDPDAKPGVANLLEILAACTGADPAGLAKQFDGYGQLKAAVADAVVAELAPVQARYAALAADPAAVHRTLAIGAQRASERTAGTVQRARAALGLLLEQPQ
jgi:tryptophanyl-tRNA synthetase